MVVVQRGNIGVTPTGGFLKPTRRKKLFERGRHPTLPRVGAVKKISTRMKGGERKTRLLLGDVANLYDPKTKKHIKAKITIVTDNKANRHYVRRNVLTKGAVIETDKGKARVTNKPGQEGQVNAVLI